MNNVNEFDFQVIPRGLCPRCDPADERYGFPIAVAVGAPNCAITRYVCQGCRLVWDAAQDVSGEEYKPFRTTLIRASQNIVDHDADSYPWPPRSVTPGGTE